MQLAVLVCADQCLAAECASSAALPADAQTDALKASAVPRELELGAAATGPGLAVAVA